MVENYEEGVQPTQRRRMLREIIHHQEAIDRMSWENPPIEPGDNASSYLDMMRDPTVSYCIDLIKEAVLQPWFIDPADADNSRAVALAEDIRKNLEDINLAPALDDALSAIWRGFCPHEIKWRHGQRRFWLDDLAAIDPEQIALELDDKMRVSALISKPTGAEQQRLPLEKVWFHVNRPSRTRPAGSTVLEPAFRPWSSKNRLLQFWGLSLQRFGSTQWLIQIPANTPPARQTSLLNIFYQGRLDGVYLVPEDVAATQLNQVQWANLAYETAIDYQDAEITKAILLIAGRGSVATGQTYVTGAGIEAQSRSTAYRLQRISRALSESFTRQVIRPLCEANWGNVGAICPRLVLPTPDHQRIVALAAPLAQLRSGAMIDAAVAAEQLGLPEPTEAAPMPIQQKGAPTNG